MAVSPEGHKVEAGIFGREGFGPAIALASDDICASEILVQIAGNGHRLPVGAFRRIISKSAEVRTLLTRFTHTLTTQASYTALSNAVHQVDERLARWLLMCHDRSEGDEMALTHEFLSLMLSVRRPTVTTTLHVLEGNGFIRAERGHITITDRSALEDFAKDAYGVPEDEYRRLIGTMH